MGVRGSDHSPLGLCLSGELDSIGCGNDCLMGMPYVYVGKGHQGGIDIREQLQDKHANGPV
jgi:hypothetical protein